MEQMTLNKQVQKGNDAVRSLRRDRLVKGLPFMINATGLDDATCYMEYPDGRIELVRQSPNGADFERIASLSAREADSLRRQYQLH